MHRSPSIVITLIFLASTLAVSRPVPSYPDVTVVASDASGITFEWRPRYEGTDRIDIGGTAYERPRFSYAFEMFSHTEGDDDIRVRQVRVALPGRTGTSVRILSADFETVGGFLLAPVPRSTIQDDLGAEAKEYRPNGRTGNGFFPSSVVRLRDVSTIRGWNIGMIEVAPYQYNASARTLRKYSRITVRVDFGPGSGEYRPSGNDDWAKATMVNYDVGRSFGTRSSGLRKAAAVHSVLSTGVWYKLSVSTDGIYMINDAYLRTLGIDRASLSSIYDIKIFGADGRIIPPDLSAPRPDDLPQVAVDYLDNNGNGKFDSDDAVLFYGNGVTGWNYTAGNRTYSHYTNPYTNNNSYFLAVGAAAPVKTMAIAAGASIPAQAVTTAKGRDFFDEEKFNFIQSGLNWVSAPFNPGDSRVVSNRLYGRVEGTPVLYKYVVYSRADVGATFVIEESGQTIATPFLSGMSQTALNSSTGSYAYSASGQATLMPALADERSNVKFTYNANSNAANGFIDWLEVSYTRSLAAVSDVLMFDGPDTSGVVGYSLTSFSTNAVSVYDVTDPNAVRKIVPRTDQILGSLSFADTCSPGNPKRYWAGTASRFLTPTAVVKIPDSDLHAAEGADFIIITHSEFRAEANRLKAHKESLPQPISTIVADVDTIYNEFGIGMPDPVSLRDFLRYAVDHWPVTPKYVLFFGDASYDYKSILGTDRSWVPTIQSPESNDKIYSYNYEDFFGYLDPAQPTTVSIAHGRLCPRSESDARFLVDRIIQYESKQTYSPWKNIVTIIADDIWTTDPDAQNETFHVVQAEGLAQNYTPKDFEIKKIYIGEYQTVFTSSGRRKPEARQAIIDQVNNGTLVLNFTGHGNPKVWAHEYILTLDDVKTQFTNSDKLTFIVAATCDWGRFEEAGESSSAEEAVINRKGGAIGVFSATRAVYSDLNSLTNRTFYSMLFSANPPLPLGDVTMLTKNDLDGTSYQSLVNKQKYFLLGDPTLRLAIPRGVATVDSINGMAVAVVDTLKSLGKISMTASVRDTSMARETGYNGTALVTVYDSERDQPIAEFPGFTYEQNGAVIYRGENSIVNGALHAAFIVPKDISYENRNGRISMYFSNANGDGRGYTTNFIVGGTSASAGSDSVGPGIAVYMDNTSFRSGDIVTENPTLIVELRDSSGINSSGSGIGHRIEAWLDGSAKSIDLTGYYKGKIDSYQEGSVEYPFTGLAPGSHSITVRGWDVYNNSTSAEAFFTVASSEGLSIYNVYNIPNPIRTATTFTFQFNQTATVDAEVRIYSVAGRLIRTLQKYGVTDRFVAIDWDTRDADGDEVGNGVYFYRVSAATIDGRFSSEATGKLAVVR